MKKNILFVMVVAMSFLFSKNKKQLEAIFDWLSGVVNQDDLILVEWEGKREGYYFEFPLKFGDQPKKFKCIDGRETLPLPSDAKIVLRKNMFFFGGLLTCFIFRWAFNNEKSSIKVCFFMELDAFLHLIGTMETLVPVLAPL